MTPRMEYEYVELKMKLFKKPENAEGIVEIIEAFTDDSGKVMKDQMEERKDAERTYEEEICSVVRALDNHWEYLDSHTHFWTNL